MGRCHRGNGTRILLLTDRQGTPLAAYTTANAYAGFQESLVGRIAADCLADIVVIDRDLTTIPAAEIQKARILATYVGGRQRFEA